MAHLSHHHAYSWHHVYSGGKSKHTNPTHRFPKKITVTFGFLGTTLSQSGSHKNFHYNRNSIPDPQK